MSEQLDQVQAGFNRDEPRYAIVALFGLVTVVTIAILIFALEFLYDRYREQQVYVKQQVPIWQDLKSLRAREEGALGSYGYVDKTHGVVRIPVGRAMDLLVKEAAEDKLPYNTAPQPVPPPQPVGMPPAQGTATGAVNAAQK